MDPESPHQAATSEAAESSARSSDMESTIPETLGGSWDPCNLDEGNLSSLELEGWIAAKEISRWQVDPGAAMPAPSDGEIVMLKSHIDRGFSLPPSYFLKGILRHYRLQLHHIAPNSFTIIAGFVALCKGYLGIYPRGDLFHLYFNICHNRDANGDPRNCGSVSFFLGVGNHTLISNHMIQLRGSGDLSSIRLTKPLLKGSTVCGLLLMVPPRSRIAGALWTILPWMTNSNSAHDGFPNLCFLD
jgi:hypothetical protein